MWLWNQTGGTASPDSTTATTQTTTVYQKGNHQLTTATTVTTTVYQKGNHQLTTATTVTTTVYQKGKHQYYLQLEQH